MRLTRLPVVLPLILLPLQTTTQANFISPSRPVHPSILISLDFVPVKKAPNYTESVLKPLYAAQEARRIAEAARLAEEARLAQVAADAAIAAQAAIQQETVQTAPTQAAPTNNDGLIAGTLGYAFAGGNCVNQIAPNLRPGGNPITWPVTTMTPYIGAAGLFSYNHVVRVVGLWSNGDVEVANENWSGVPVTRFPRSAFRGFR